MFMFHFPRIHLIFFLTNFVVKFKLFNDQNIILIEYDFGFTIGNPLVYVINYSKTKNPLQPDKNCKS